MKKITILLLALASIVQLNAQKLTKFGGLTEKKVGPKTIKVPYTDVTTYLGYAAKGNEDEVKDGKKYYYLYLWIPAVAPELGVRMMSPVGNAKVKNAIESDAYVENKSSTAYFDTYITLERSDIYNKEGATLENIQKANWNTLARNDDSGEMPSNPGGRKYNSLLRYKSQVSDPTKALTVGLYRIGFTTYKTGEVEGTFLAEIGAPIKLPGVIVTKDITKLIEQLNQ